MDNFEKSKSHWYVLQAMSGQENRAMKAIQIQRELDAREGIDDGVDDIRIPIYKVQVAQTNAKGVREVVTKERKHYPGYVLIQARLYKEDGELNPDVWDMVKGTQGVIGFIGGNNPVMLSETEVTEMLYNEEVEQPKARIAYKVGEKVSIKNGAFQGFDAVVEAIDNERARLKVSVNIFGRSTAIELANDEVEKIS